MNSLHSASDCAPLMEACTLGLYEKNIFRITGLPVDATAKEIARQVQKLQMLEEMGGAPAGPVPAFSPMKTPTTDEIRAALARMKEPEQRLVDEFFWYWPEQFGASKDDAAIQALLSGDQDGAINLWRKREREGSLAARHNMAVMYHMHAVDWSLYHFRHALKTDQEDLMRTYWRKAAERWELVVAAERTGELVKERVLSLEDEGLTTGFARRMVAQLPQALDRVSAEAALRLAEQGQMDWAQFHVDLMRETHQGEDDVERVSELVLASSKARFGKLLESFRDQAEQEPDRVEELVKEMVAKCRPITNVFDLFFGPDAHQRNDVFDQLAETILGITLDHWNKTKDNELASRVLATAVLYVNGQHLKDRIHSNLEIVGGNIVGEKLEPAYQKVVEIRESKAKSKAKYREVLKNVMPLLPELAAEAGESYDAFNSLRDAIAVLLKEIAVQAHNDEKNHVTAAEAIRLAHHLVIDPGIKARIEIDKKVVEDHQGTSCCSFCKEKQGDPKRKIGVAMHLVTDRTPQGVRYNSNTFWVPRCSSCHEFHKRHWKYVWWAAGVGLVLGGLLAPWSSVIGASLAVVIFGGWVRWWLYNENALMSVVIIFGIVALVICCFNLKEDPIAREVLPNMLGGALLLGTAVLLVARKILNPKSPKSLALADERITGPFLQGWRPGERPVF